MSNRSKVKLLSFVAALLAALSLVTPAASAATPERTAFSRPAAATVDGTTTGPAAKACFPRGSSNDRFKYNYCDGAPLFGTAKITPDGNCQVGHWEWWRINAFDIRIILPEQWICAGSSTQLAPAVAFTDQKICVRVFIGSTVWGNTLCDL